MKMSDLQPYMLVHPTGPASRGALFKVSTVYPDCVTVEQVLPVPPRTTVRTYGEEQVRTWETPSDALVRDYEAAYSLTQEGT